MAIASVIINQQDHNFLGQWARWWNGRLDDAVGMQTQQFGVMVQIMNRLQATLDIQLPIEPRQVIFNGFYA